MAVLKKQRNWQEIAVEVVLIACTLLAAWVAYTLH